MSQKVRRSLREGRVYLDGEMVMDLVTCEILFTPDIGESRALGEKGKSRRWLGFDITGSISQYRSTPWLKTAVKKYVDSGATPSFTVVGMQDDSVADYDIEYGKDVITVEDMVITGDIPLLNLDTEGEFVQDEIEFGARNVVLS